MSTFETFGLPLPLARALKTLHYEVPTPIQMEAIPVAMQGHDLIGIAQTGTGKTAAFGIPLVVSLLKDPRSTALILAPTRELATQIQEVLKALTQNVREIQTALLIGGASMNMQVQSLRRNPRFIIATPGRLLDHVAQRTVSLSQMKFVVLDEADRMLDIGFEPQLRRIFQHLPKERQTLLFSATFPTKIETLAAHHLKQPKKIGVARTSEPAKKIRQSFLRTTEKEKNNALMKELHARTGSVLIFARTKRRTDRVTKMLWDSGMKADRIHGNCSQGQRNRVMQNFRNQKFRVLVATDIASRGLDIPHIEHVINYDLPQVPEDYIHRIGRTARAGAKGEAVCFVTPEDRVQWKDLSRHLTNTATGFIPRLS